MASKVKRNFTASVQGTPYEDEGRLLIEVEDVETPINVLEFAKDFLDKGNVKITFSYGEDLV